MKRHIHNFKIILAEVDSEGREVFTKECNCGKIIKEMSASGEWRK